MRSVLVVGLLLATTVTTRAVGQEAAQSLFGDTVDVRIVNVEAVVTDKDGNRVLGLSPSDFRLLVDGEEVPIDYFNEVRQGAALAAESATVAGIGSLEAGKPVGTSYLLFIDESFSLPRDRDRVLEALKEDVTFLRPEDRLAVVAFDGRQVEMLTTWTSSWVEVQKVLDAAKDRPAFGLHRLSEERNYRRDLRSNFQRRAGAPGGFDSRLDIEEERYATEVAENVGRATSAAAAALRGFAQPPGRKVMLVLSGGWPFDPVNVATADPGRGFGERGIPRGRELFAPLVDTANQLGYTLYAVDVPGLEANGIADSSRDAPSDNDFDGNREYEVHQALRHVAYETGGTAMLNGQRLDTLRTAAEDTRSYYWLGFSPSRKGDDARHSVKVEVRRPGLEVRSRGDYLDSSRRAEVSMAVESALLFGSGATSDGVLRVAVGNAARSGMGRVKVPLMVDVPLDQVTALPSGDRWQVLLELRVAVRDEGGATADIPVIPITLYADEQPGAGRWGRFETTVELRKADHDLVVAIYDPASGALLTSPARVEL
jgi:VWFA-related protein